MTSFVNHWPAGDEHLLNVHPLRPVREMSKRLIINHKWETSLLGADVVVYRGRYGLPSLTLWLHNEPETLKMKLHASISFGWSPFVGHNVFVLQLVTRLVLCTSSSLWWNSVLNYIIWDRPELTVFFLKMVLYKFVSLNCSHNFNNCEKSEPEFL